MKILVIDLPTKSVAERPLADPLLGGRLLTDLLVTEFVDPKAEPLGPGNILAFAAGPLAGYRVSTAGRLSIGGKSPLTQGIKEANAGGMAGDSLAGLGYRAMVFKGASPQGQPVVFILDASGPRFVDARPYMGLSNEQLAEALRKDYGDEYVMISIGQGGEQQLLAAGIAVSDANGQPFRMAARGGLGAVMGSKGLKAILLRRAGRRSGGAPNPEARAATVGFQKHVATSPRTETLRKFGTASTVMLVQTLGGMTVRNFSSGTLENAEQISGDELYAVITQRDGAGTPTEACMEGCVIQCSNIFPGPNGKLAVAPLEFETLGLCGANLGLTSLDDIARINRICNDLGLDTIEIGAALGVMMEAAEAGSLPQDLRQANLPKFGDGTRAAELVAEIGQGTPLGKLLGNGVVAVGKALGVQRIPAVKGQAMSAYDPRGVKGTGVTYATSPQGADHTAGLTVFAPVDHLDPKLAVSASRASQIQRASYDALGLCVFNLGASGQKPELVLNMLRSIYGVELADNWLDELGLRVVKTELAFNRAAGMTPADDRLPDYFSQEALAPHNSVFDVPAEALDAIWG